MKKLLLVALALLGSVAASAETRIITTDYDLDDAVNYRWPVLCTPGVITQTAVTCPGQGRGEQKRVTTAGVSTTALTSVASNGAFTDLLAGDEIEVLSGLQGPASRVRRLVTDRASADAVTLNTAVEILAAGQPFSWWKRVAATGDEDGWFNVGDTAEFDIVIGFFQANVTGGINYQVQCRDSYLDVKGPVVVLAGPTNVTTFSATSTARVNVYKERFAECRVGFLIGTADDGGDLTTNLERLNVWIETGGGQ